MNTLKTMGQRFVALISGQEANQNCISLFDVKGLYDAAYAEKAKARTCLRTFKALLEKAELMDAAYREQLRLDQVHRFGRAA